MATMTIKTEVEATADNVAAHLAVYAAGDDAKVKAEKFAADWANAKFPANAGDLIYLTDIAAQTFGALPDMPALVLAAPVGSPMALIAVATETELVKTARISPFQLARVVRPPAGG